MLRVPTPFAQRRAEECHNAILVLEIIKTTNTVHSETDGKARGYTSNFLFSYVAEGLSNMTALSFDGCADSSLDVLVVGNARFSPW